MTQLLNKDKVSYNMASINYKIKRPSLDALVYLLYNSTPRKHIT